MTSSAPAIAPGDLPALRTLLDAAAPLRRFSLGTDRLGVWICHVALDIDDDTYNRVEFRLALDPATVAGLLGTYVTPYYHTLSNGRYEPTFVAGGEVSIGKSDTDLDCVERARASAGDDIDGLVVVADAEHAPDEPGGWGRPGDLCALAAPACPATVTGRATYIGASDFNESWGPEPAVDLQEHELGHSLGFPHSGAATGHTSALDVMSNSAAPRDVDAARRDGPGTLAVNRLAAGWLLLDAVTVAGAGGGPSGGAGGGSRGGRFALVGSDADSGPRLLVLPIDGLRFVTVEVLRATGFDAHLPESGVALHLIDQRSEACHSLGSADPCLNELRRQTPLGSATPNTDLLTLGESTTIEGWTVTVVASGPVWTVEVG